MATSWAMPGPADFFFFKQKTAYEVVSRDWSSDVCSDLELHLITILVKDVQLAVKLNGKIGQPFTTNIGTPQIGRASRRERV